MAESPLQKASADDDPNDTAAFEGPSTLPSNSAGATSDVTTDFDQDSHPSASTLSAQAVKQPQHSSIGGYRLEKLLGEGGMGRVYKGLDGQGRAVAVKLLSARWSTSGEALQRFKQEGYIASQINHPHCVFVHRVDEDRGTPFIAMELMTGKTLKDLVGQRGPLPFREAVQLILQCIEGLIEAHRQGMIHRDIKPANCYLDDSGNVKVGDFGLARSLVDDSELTRTGAFLGTPLFASPEQLLGQTLDERSDIYSLSATLYYLLAGRAPFESPNAAQVIAKIASSDPPTFAEVGVKIPPVLEAIVMRGLARDRNKRFESFQQLRAALLPIVTTESDISSLPRRALAGMIDSITVGTAFGATTLLAMTFGMPQIEFMRQWFPLASSAGTSTFLFVYYCLQEWLLGCSLGKRLMRLRVVDSETGGPTRLRQIVLRTALFILICNGAELAFNLFFRESLSLVPFVAWASELAGWAILLTGWWLTGYKQFPHEWLSGTLTKLVVQRRAAVNVQMELPTYPTAHVAVTEPRTIGRFKITGRLQTVDQTQWFVAHDEGLDREVWINRLPLGAPPLSEARKSCTRRARMRVIESGMEGFQSWDAYLAPEGVPLAACFNSETVLPWPLARQLLHQLIDEHSSDDSAALQEADWNANRVWLDAAGRATFCEPQLAAAPASSISGIDNLLSDVAWAALPLRHRTRRKNASRIAQQTSAGKAKVRELAVADLPPYRGLRFLERLVEGKYQLGQLSNELTRIDQTNEQVTPSLRLAHALTIGIATLPILLTIWLLMATNSIILVNHVRKDARSLVTLTHVLESPAEYPQAFDGGPPELQPQSLRPETIEDVRSAAVRANLASQHAYENLNALERYVLTQAQLTAEAFQTMPKPFFIDREESTAAAEAAGPRIRVRGQADVNIVAEGMNNGRVPEKELVATYYPIYRSWLAGKMSDEDNLQIARMVGGFFIAIWSWTVISGGGVIPMFTGVACVRRDGCRMSRLRIAWRTTLVLAPFAIVAFLCFYLESLGPSWLSFTLHLKTLFAVLPLLYLVGAIAWPHVGPHDRLSYTAAVPR